MSLIETALAQSDPANAVLLALVYRRLDRRLAELRADLEAVES